MKKEMLINVLQPEECRIAIVEDGVLEELYVERTSHESYTGNIYKGRIVNLEPAIQAAFVDFSVGRNGFLHVSDVEPQYYYRNQIDEPEASPRDNRRERDDRRRGRTIEDRDLNAAPPPPRLEERFRERDRDRPDRSERGRRDRSEPRRFGEGLLDENWSPPPPPRPAEPASRAESKPLERDETRRVRAEAPSLSWAEESVPGRTTEREARPAEVDEPRGRIGRVAESFDPDLPPSRTQRSRLPSPPARPLDFGFEEAGRFRTPPEPLDVAPEPEPEPPSAREPRRPRGRGRPVRPAEPEVAFEVEPEAEFLNVEPEPIPDEPSESPRAGAGGPRSAREAASASRSGRANRSPIGREASPPTGRLSWSPSGPGTGPANPSASGPQIRSRPAPSPTTARASRATSLAANDTGPPNRRSTSITRLSPRSTGRTRRPSPNSMPTWKSNPVWRRVRPRPVSWRDRAGGVAVGVAAASASDPSANRPPHLRPRTSSATSKRTSTRNPSPSWSATR